jgi:hypothetical protein
MNSSNIATQALPGNLAGHTVYSPLSDCALFPAIIVTCRESSLKGGNSHTKASARRPLRQSLNGNLRLYGLYYILLTSGPFGKPMSSAARPKRWGVFCQAKGRQFDPSRPNLSPYRKTSISGTKKSTDNLPA